MSTPPSGWGQRHTHLGQVVYEGQVGLLQLCSGQRWQGVGIVQLSAVVRWKQVWIQADHMGGICTGGADLRYGSAHKHS